MDRLIRRSPRWLFCHAGGLVAWGTAVVLMAGCAPQINRKTNGSSADTKITIVAGGACGAEIDPLVGAEHSLVALVFISHECPIANAMVPDLRAIAAKAKASGVAFFLVHAATWTDDAQLRSHAEDFSLTTDVCVLADRGQRLVRATGATITPEAALLRLDGRGGFHLLYLGRVNDLYTGIGRRRASATSNDFEVAIDAARNGMPIHAPSPKAVGCFIEVTQ